MQHFPLSRLGPAVAHAAAISVLALTFTGCVTTKEIAPGFGQAPNPELAASLADPLIEPTDKLRIRVVPAPGSKDKHLLEAHDLIQVRFAFDQGDYHIMAGDELYVQFAENAKLDVRAVVRPDGKMTFPNLGDLLVAGKTPANAAKEIEQMYAGRMNKPENTVTVVTANTALIDSMSSELTVRPDGVVTVPLLGEFQAAGSTPGELALRLTSAAGGRFHNKIAAYITTRERSTIQETLPSALLGFDKSVDVAPDGRLVLPEIGAIDARNRSLSQLREAITVAARRRYTNPIEVSVTLEASERRSFYIAGDVNKPGNYPWSAQMTAMKALAMAGGVTNDANLRGLVLVHYNPDGSVTVYKADAKAVIGNKNAFNDVALSPQDMIYVPKTIIAKADLFVQQYIDKLLPFVRSVNYSYTTIPTQQTTF